MTGSPSRDVARILDRLTNRVDRLENQGEDSTDVQVFERHDEAVVFEDDGADITVWGPGEDAFVLGAGESVIGFGEDPIQIHFDVSEP